MVRFLIHKPIAVLMTALAVIILGLIAWGFIPVSLMPELDIPEVTVQLSADMSARELEDAVVRPMRNSLMQVNHLEDIKSETYNGSALIRLIFDHGTSIDYSFIEVNEKIDRAMSGLPRGVERPRVIKASASDIPVFYLNLSLKEGVDTRENGELNQAYIDFNRFANQVIRKRIEQLPEVAMVDVNGIIAPEILIVPDPEKLRALGIGLDELENALKSQDVEIGSILVKDNQYQYNLRLGFSLDHIRDIEEIYLNIHDRLFQLKDLAEIREKPQKRRGLALFNDREAISMALIKQGDVRMSNFKEGLNTAVAQMEKDYPDVAFTIVRDQTKLLEESINNLGQGLFWSISLGFLIMFFFLKDFSSPMLIGASVPISLIVSLLFFHLLGISINIISLSGLILGTGLMIDNSIIVIDNITQYRIRGLTLSAACVKGTNEVIIPLLSSVLTTCAVFIPLIFLSGMAGALFYDQAMAITIGLLVSLLVSVTLVPVLYRLFHLKEGPRKKIDAFLKKINVLDYEDLYEKGFRFVMKKQIISWGLFVLLVGVTITLFKVLPKEQIPFLTTHERVYTIDWNEPLNVEENKKRVLALAETIEADVENYNAQVGQQQFLLNKETQAKTSEVEIYVQVTSPGQLKTIDEKTQDFVRNYPEAVMETSDVDNIFNLIFTLGKAPITARFQAKGFADDPNAKLQSLWDDLQHSFKEMPLEPISWEDQITLKANTAKMELYRVSPDQLSTTLVNAFSEQQVLAMVDNQDFVPVILGAEEKNIEEVLATTLVRTNDTTSYKISNFLTPQLDKDLKKITAGKEGEYYPIDFVGVEEGKVPFIVNRIKDFLKDSAAYDVNFSGSYFDNRALIKELMMVLAITLALLFFILATQFESLALPIIILLEIPIAAAGAFFFLWLFGMSINLMSMIGIVVMSGIVINDSILKIDTIIQLQKQGYSLLKALLVAGQRRLKPIIMTSMTTILALVPVLFTTGLGSELQSPLAIALIGGMMVGTFVSLYFIPLLYYYLKKNKHYAS